MARNTGIEIGRVVAAIAVFASNLPLDNAPKSIEAISAVAYIVLPGKIGVAFFLVCFGYFISNRCVRISPEIVPAAMLKTLFKLWIPVGIMLAACSVIDKNMPGWELITTAYNYTSSTAGYKDVYMPLWTICLIIQAQVLLTFVYFFFRTKEGRVRALSVWLILGLSTGVALDIYDQLRFIEYNYKSLTTHGAAVALGALISLRGVPKVRAKHCLLACGAWAIAIGLNVPVLIGEAHLPYTLILMLIITVAATGMCWLHGLKLGESDAIISISVYTYAIYLVQGPVMNWVVGIGGSAITLTSYLFATLATLLAAIALTKLTSLIRL